MDPEALEAFILSATPQQLADQLRGAYHALRCMVTLADEFDLPVLFSVPASASG